MNLPPPPQGGDPIITQFNPVYGQWGLNDDNINRIDRQTGQTILHNYCRHINTTPLEVYRYLIEVKGCDVNVRGKDRDTPLDNALCYFNPNGDINVLMYLLSQKGVNGNTNDLCGFNLLHTACDNINALPIDVFKLLIETMGCDVNAQNTYNDTPLHFAFRCFDPQYGGDITALTYLANQTTVHANVNDKRGYTILHYACQAIHDLPIEIFKLLIEKHGADVNAQNNDDDTPLHIAFRSFDPNYDSHLVPVLVYLVDQKNIDVNIKDQNGLTLLHLVCLCEIGYYSDDDDDDDDDNDDDDHSDDGLEDSVIGDKLNQEADTNLSQIVEAIAERCVQQVFDETNLE